jgi:hypothetical protein
MFLCRAQSGFVINPTIPVPDNRPEIVIHMAFRIPAIPIPFRNVSIEIDTDFISAGP